MSYDPHSSSPPPPTFPPPDHPILAEFADKPRESRIGRRTAAFAAILLASVACVSIGMWLVPREMLQWRIASAEEQRLNGDAAGAMQKLEQDIQKNPRNIALRRKKAEWLLADKEYKAALSEVNQIITWRPADTDAYSLRAFIYHSMGEHQKAVDDCKRVLSFDAISSGPERANALNSLAYARALANIEIDQGLVDISEAMRMKGEDFAMLDTRGFLYYRKGDLDRALNDLQQAVMFAEEQYAVLSSAPRVADRRLKKISDQRVAQMLAVIRYHRGLIHEARKETSEAEADFERVLELGFEPNEKLF